MARGLILAARHPRPLAGARICYGNTDTPLAEPAEAGADALMAAVGEERIERIISSPLARAMTVARVVALRTGAPLHADDRLRDQDFGRWEGQAWSALPRSEVAPWEADPLYASPGGGESMQAVLRRVRHAWPRIASAEETTLLLTHAAVIQCLLHVALHVPVADAIGRGIAYGAVIRLDPNPA